MSRWNTLASNKCNSIPCPVGYPKYWWIRIINIWGNPSAQLDIPDKGCAIKGLTVCYIVWLESIKGMGLQRWRAWVWSFVVVRIAFDFKYCKFCSAKLHRNTHTHKVPHSWTNKEITSWISEKGMFQKNCSVCVMTIQ